MINKAIKEARESHHITWVFGVVVVGEPMRSRACGPVAFKNTQRHFCKKYKLNTVHFKTAHVALILISALV